MKTKFTFLLTLVFMCCSLAMAQTTVKGTVVSDTDSEPMIGVAILEQGTSNGTITDFNGEFTLKVTDSKATLRVSYVGYATQVVNVGNATRFSIRLKEDSQLLDDVVVIGYGIQKKSDVTGAIASVKGSDLETVLPAMLPRHCKARLLACRLSTRLAHQALELPFRFVATLLTPRPPR